MARSLWLKIMYRDQWQCKISSPYCPGKANQVGHIILLAKWGKTEESNLQAAADVCNKWKGTKIL
jgi:hypothetical protein